MGIYKYIRKTWKQPKANLGSLWQQRLILWRRQPTAVRINKPTRLDKARSIGYRAKQGIFVIRQRVMRGGHRRPETNTHITIGKRYQVISEERAAKKYPNCEVLNSYEVAKDGRYYWFEIIMVDRAHPAIKKDKELKFVAQSQRHRGRVFRGKTAAGKRSRGILTKKGKGAEKLRPSLRANKRRSK